MSPHCYTKSRNLDAILCLIILVLMGSVVGCSSSQHSTGQTGFIKKGDRVEVEVLLDEYKIHMPTTIPAGHVDFLVTNTGKHEHSIKISGQGVDKALPENLKPGESTHLSMDLKPGTYKVECPVGPHATLGMRLELTVTQ